MKVFKTVEVPATTRQQLISRKCDLCGTESKYADWGAGRYEVEETEIKVIVSCRTGTEYPECGSGTEYEIDLCPKCFKDRLVPWLQSQGAYIKETEWEW